MPHISRKYLINNLNFVFISNSTMRKIYSKTEYALGCEVVDPKQTYI